LNQDNTGESALDPSTGQGPRKSTTSHSFLSLVLINAGVCLVCLMLAFACAEIIFRQFSPTVQEGKAGGHRVSQNLVLLYEPIPGPSTTGDKVNSDGLRDREYSVAKPAGIRRILVLGDDVVHGYGVAAEDSLPKRLEATYQANGHSVEVLNFGVSGYNTEQEIEFFKTKGIKYRPDIVVMTYVLNDNRYASQELRDLSDFKFLAAPKATSANLFKRGAASLLHSSRFLQFLGAQWGIERKLPSLRDYPRLIEYVEEKNLLERDLSDSKYAQLENQIQVRAEQIGTSPDALEFSIHALGFTPTHAIYQSHWNASYQALTRLKALSDEYSFQVVVAVLPILYQMDRYPLKPAHDFFRKEFESLGFQTVDLLEICRHLYGVYGYSAVSPDGIHLTPVALKKVAGYLYNRIPLDRPFRPGRDESLLVHSHRPDRKSASH
jgi:hypothetical protein